MDNKGTMRRPVKEARKSEGRLGRVRDLYL